MPRAATLSSRRKTDYAVHSVENALELLEAICDEGGSACIPQLSQRLGMNKTSVYRLLATFEKRGFVEKIAETGIYRIGVNAFIVGRKLLSRMGLLQQARPVMEDLCRRCNEAVYLAIRRGSEFLFIDMVDCAQQVKITPLVGRCFPLPIAAPGQVMLAYAEAPESSQEGTPGALSGIRLKGFCHEQGGLGEMVGCLAAPLFNGIGSVAGALCIVGPTYRMPELQAEASVWPLLRDASEAISSKLGYLKPYLGNVRL